MSNQDYRDRFKHVTNANRDKSDDIFKLWNDQKKMQAEDKKLQEELDESKKKAKELKKTLRKHRYGEAKDYSLEKTKTVFKKSKITLQTKLNNVFDKTSRKVTMSSITAIFVLFGASFIFIIRHNNKTATLGESNQKLTVEQDLPREKPTFKLLLPAGTKYEDYDVVRISPDKSDASYTYLDRFTENGQIFRVTEQEIPPNFELDKTAKDFQATSVIQVDDITVYHGYSEQGGIQSLIFEKDKRLVSIRSPQKFSDDQWAAYISSLE